MMIYLVVVMVSVLCLRVVNVMWVSQVIIVSIKMKPYVILIMLVHVMEMVLVLTKLVIVIQVLWVCNVNILYQNVLLMD